MKDNSSLYLLIIWLIPAFIVYFYFSNKISSHEEYEKYLYNGIIDCIDSNNEARSHLWESYEDMGNAIYNLHCHTDLTYDSWKEVYDK